MPPPATTTSQPAEPAAEPPPDPLPAGILAAFRSTVRQESFSQRTAKGIIATARQIAADHCEPLADAEIEACIWEAWNAASKKVNTIAFYITALPEKLEALFERRQRERDDAADQASRPQPTAQELEALQALVADAHRAEAC